MYNKYKTAETEKIIEIAFETIHMKHKKKDVSTFL